MIPNRLSTLGHPQRLAVFRLLMRRYPDRVPAGELAEALGLKPSTLSAYLAALMQAGLVGQERSGTSLRYSIAMDAIRQTFDYLLLDCCRGRPDVCAPASPARDVNEAEAFRVLFLCSGNSARSIMAEAILRREAGDRFEVHSAGTEPRPAPNPHALALLTAEGHDTGSLRSKDVSEFRGRDTAPFDIVITLCNRASNRDCPPWPGRPLGTHWNIPAPAQGAGGESEASRRFRRAHDALQKRIRALAALPLRSLDRLALQQALDDIGRSDMRVSA